MRCSDVAFAAVVVKRAEWLIETKLSEVPTVRATIAHRSTTLMTFKRQELECPNWVLLHQATNAIAYLRE